MPRFSFTRSDDERDLKILELRCAGISMSVIAERFGMTRGAVAGLTNRIRKADVAESGEPDTSEGYW